MRRLLPVLFLLCAACPAQNVFGPLNGNNTWTGAQTFNGVVSFNITGSAQCLQVNSSGVVGGTGSACSTGGVTGATANGGLLQTGTTLGLLTSCSTNQVLQWNGTVWACATISGSGTVTGTGVAGDFALWSGTSAIGDSTLSTSANKLIWGGSQGICANSTCGTALGSRWVSYNGTNTASNGMPAVVGIQEGSSFTGNMSATNIGPSYASSSGVMARISCYNVVTTAATASSTLPSCVASWTDLQTSTVETATFASTCVPSCTSNTVGTFIQGSIVIQPKVGTTPQVSTTGYASSGATSMAWANDFVIEWF